MSTELVAIVLMVIAVPLLVTAFYAWFVVLGPHIAGRPTGVREVPLPQVNVSHTWHQDLPVIPAALDLPRYQARAPQAATMAPYADPAALRDVLDPWRSPQGPDRAGSSRHHARRPVVPAHQRDSSNRHRPPAHAVR